MKKTRRPSTHAYKNEDVAQGFLAGVLTHDIGVRNAIPAHQGRDDNAVPAGENDAQ
ncbi:hypothetical protein [Citrobacter freundii]|uniref:Uncharacterized protein n=1 Tax=Citrobacter freundii TaxID=546 RepID=A0A7G2IT94_CITFR|nr:hypothetical protein [Citrobacter freundii]